MSKLHSGTSKTVHLPLFWKSHCATCSFCTMWLGHAKGLLYWANTNINIGNECSLVKHPTILYLICVLQCFPTRAVLLMLSMQLKAIFQIVCYKQSLLFLCDCGAKRKLWKLGPWWGASICVIPLGQPFPESFLFLESISREKYWFLHWPSGFNNLSTVKKNGGRCRLTFPSSSLVFLKI